MCVLCAAGYGQGGVMIARKLFFAACMLCVCGSMYAQQQKNDPAQTPAQQAQQPQQVRLSRDEFRVLAIQKVQPEYPVAVRAERVQGDVVLRTVFGTAGEFEGVQIISGDNRLVLPALKAVRQWKCKPYEVDGHAVEVVTDITFYF
jgi:periplasmic protein TonB